jgi:hypothetical protein
MPFGMPEPTKTLFKKTLFFSPEPGTHILRFLEPTVKAAQIDQHWLPASKTSVKCLGENCPICENNRLLLAENPGKKYNEIKGLNFPTLYAHINVLDKTPVKICPNPKCGHEVKADVTGNFPPVCPHCITVQTQTLVVNEPVGISGKVKNISLSRTLAGQVDAQEKGKLDTEGNPIPITAYDFEVFIVTSGDKKNIIFKAHPEWNAVETVPEDALFDNNNSVMKLERDELIALLKGTQLRDIFAARKEAKVTVTETVTAPSLTQDEIQKKISELMTE